MELETKPGREAGSPPAAPVAGQPAPGATGNLSAPIPAAASVPRFGGNRGGKARKDGLAPGSPEAIAADKKRDRERKQALRKESARLAEPPALPSAVPAGTDSAAPAPGGEMPGAGDAAAPQDVLVPWESATLKPLFDELIDTAEAGRVEKFRAIAQKAALPLKVVSEIASDAKYSPMLKRTLSLSAPNATAKTLNRLGLSGKYSDEGIFLTALVANFVQGRRLAAKLEKLIAENKAAEKKSSDGKV